MWFQLVIVEGGAINDAEVNKHNVAVNIVTLAIFEALGGNKSSEFEIVISAISVTKAVYTCV